MASLLVLAAASVSTQAPLDRRLGAFRAQEEALYLWSGEHVQRLVPGLRGAWPPTSTGSAPSSTSAGSGSSPGTSGSSCWNPLIDITTTLDPRLEIAYRYGAVFLSEPPPVGAGRPRAGVALLERGVANLPQSWRLRQDLGFFTFLFLGDSQRAAAILLEASRIPGAAFWLRTLAADVLSKGGDRASARRMWQQMYDQAEGGLIKVNAREHLRVLDTEEQADRLTAAVAEYERRFGRRPAKLEEVTARALAPGPLKDEGGVPFAYDPATGLVTVSRQSPLWRAK